MHVGTYTINEKNWRQLNVPFTSGATYTISAEGKGRICNSLNKPTSSSAGFPLHNEKFSYTHNGGKVYVKASGTSDLILNIDGNAGEYSAIIGFEPTKIAFDYTKGDVVQFFKEATDNFLDVSKGRFKYLEAGNIWNINGIDENGSTVFENYQLYTEDLEDAGFVFIVPMSEFVDEEEIEYYISFTGLKNSSYRGF